MKPGHQRTVVFVLILVTRQAISLTAFGEGDHYAFVRGGEYLSYSFLCCEQDTAFWRKLSLLQYVFSVPLMNDVTHVFPLLYTLQGPVIRIYRFWQYTN